MNTGNSNNISHRGHTGFRLSWRGAVAWSYVAVCLFDFMIGPILYNVMQLYNGETAIAMWQAITLQGGGLYHLSMGAIIGISSHGRTQEKLNYQSPLTPQSPLDTN